MKPTQACRVVVVVVVVAVVLLLLLRNSSSSTGSSSKCCSSSSSSSSASAATPPSADRKRASTVGECAEGEVRGACGTCGSSWSDANASCLCESATLQQWALEQLGHDNNTGEPHFPMCADPADPTSFHAIGRVGDTLPICPVGLAFDHAQNDCVPDNSEAAMLDAFEKDIGRMPDPATLPRPRLCWWHAGLLDYGIKSAECAKAYISNIVDFANNSGKLQANDIVTLVLQSAANYKNFEITPRLIAEGFVDKLDPKFKAGVVAYIRTKDAGWEYQNGRDGGAIAPGGDPFDFSALSQSDAPCPSAEESGGGDYDATLTPPGCPNTMGQAIAFVRDVNRIAKRNQITVFLSDGEDFAPYGQPDGWATMDHLAKDTGIKVGGYAKGLPLDLPLKSEDRLARVQTGDGEPYTIKNLSYMTMPENYWMLAELDPCGGSHFQMQNRVPLCTSKTIYQRYKNDPQRLLAAMHAASRRMGERDSLKALRNQALEEARNRGTERWTANADGGDATWPMMSLEMLSKRDCLASAYSNLDHAKDQVCGTFDGFGNWQWDKFMDFMKLYAWAYNVNQVGVYEAQFVTSDWMPQQRFAVPEQCTQPSGGGGGGSGGEEEEEGGVECAFPTAPDEAHWLQPGVCASDVDCGSGNTCSPDGLCVCSRPGTGCRCALNSKSYAGDAQLYSDCPTGDSYASGCSVAWP